MSPGVEREDFGASSADIRFQHVLMDSVKTVVLHSPATGNGKVASQLVNFYLLSCIGQSRRTRGRGLCACSEDILK